MKIKKIVITISLIIIAAICILIFQNINKTDPKDLFIGEYKFSEAVYSNYGILSSNKGVKERTVPNIKYIIEENRIAIIYEPDEKFNYKNHSDYFINSDNRMQYYSPISLKTVPLDREFKYLDALTGNFMSVFTGGVMRQEDITNSYALIFDGGSVNEETELYIETNNKLVKLQGSNLTFYYINGEYYVAYLDSGYKLEKVK